MLHYIDYFCNWRGFVAIELDDSRKTVRLPIYGIESHRGDSAIYKSASGDYFKSTNP